MGIPYSTDDYGLGVYGTDSPTVHDSATADGIRGAAVRYIAGHAGVAMAGHAAEPSVGYRGSKTSPAGTGHVARSFVQHNASVNDLAISAGMYGGVFVDVGIAAHFALSCARRAGSAELRAGHITLAVSADAIMGRPMWEVDPVNPGSWTVQMVGNDVWTPQSPSPDDIWTPQVH